jgi:uncharacterized protein (TIGR00255 family)
MISSMTAFARETWRGDEGELVWEVRSVNSRFLEINLRLPEELRGLEPLVRERVSGRLNRGKVECALRYRHGLKAGVSFKVNEGLAQQLIEAAEVVEHMLHEAVPARTMDILAWPGVLIGEEQDLGPLEQRAGELLGQALGTLRATREREGARLGELIAQRCAALRELVGRARKRMPEVMVSVRERVRARLAEVLEQLDETRLEQEMALLAQRLDVDEEMDRLAAHLDEVEQVLKRKEPVGRRLDFLMQELNREANTLSSKSNDVEITRIGVEMKVLIEQMREQVQNIE